MAPFYPTYCATCGRVTLHWHRDPAGPGAPGGDCDACGGFTPVVPRDDVYYVTFTNRTDLFADLAPDQYFLGTAQKAISEAEALESAIPWALGVMHRVGLPPHGIRVGEVELRRQAMVTPHREAFHEGFWEAVNRRIQQRG